MHLYTGFHSGYTNLHFYQQSTKLLLSPHPHQLLLSLVVLIIAILTGVRCYLVVVWIYISLMISDAEHLSMYML